MAEITINGYALPDDNLVLKDLTSSDIHSKDSGRGETGVMNISYIRSAVKKLDVELLNITGAQLSALNAALAVKPQSVVYKDETGSDAAMTMYNSDVKSTLKFIDSDGNRFYNATFSLTQI